MPIYEYRCGQCGQVTSRLEKMGTDSHPSCTACGSTKTEKIFSAFSAVSPKPSGGPCPHPCSGGSCPMAQG